MGLLPFQSICIRKWQFLVQLQHIAKYFKTLFWILHILSVWFVILQLLFKEKQNLTSQHCCRSRVVPIGLHFYTGLDKQAGDWFKLVALSVRRGKMQKSSRFFLIFFLFFPIFGKFFAVNSWPPSGSATGSNPGKLFHLHDLLFPCTLFKVDFPLLALL